MSAARSLSCPAVIRAFRPLDLPAIVRSWNESAAQSAPWCPRGVFFLHHRQWLDRWIFDPPKDLPDTIAQALPVIWVAVSPDDQDRILGWIAASPYADPPRVWWVWVRDTWRHYDIATRLLAEVLANCGSKLSAGGWSRAAPGLVRATREMWLDWPDCYRPDM